MSDPNSNSPQEIPPPLPYIEPLPVEQPSMWRRALKPLGIIGILLLKFYTKVKFFILPAIKFLPLIAKTGLTMVLSIGVYAMFWGWKFALGFVVLIFIHEMGHVLAARWVNLKVSAPVFIPFIGAHILMKEMPPNARIEAIVGIGGPILGTAGAMACQVIHTWTGDPMWMALAYSGYFLNLFNLIPLTPLDGGRICAALSPWLWLPGLALLVGMMIQRGSVNVVLILILFAAVPKVWSLFKAKSEAEKRYYEVALPHRIVIALLYFSLAGLLYFQKEEAILALQEANHWGY